MTCSQNCDFVRMEVGSKDDCAWCGMMALVRLRLGIGRVCDMIRSFIINYVN